VLASSVAATEEGEELDTTQVCKQWLTVRTHTQKAAEGRYF